MHSSPTQSSNPSSNQDPASEKSTLPIQHGHQVLQSYAALPGSPNDGGSAEAAEQSPLPDADGESSPSIVLDGGSREQAGMSARSSPTANNLAAFSSRHSQRSFGENPDGSPSSGSKRHRKAPINASPIAALPNEILTHALSHLSATDLQTAALVSRRFHSVVTSPHAWRAAFARFFPGAAAVTTQGGKSIERDGNTLPSDRRSFTRLTTFASWRSEYIVRTRLLRSVARGRPMQHLPTTGGHRTNQNLASSPHVMYNSQLHTTVNHLHATFGTGLAKRFPQFIHGADDIGMATSSDPITGKVANWGLSAMPPFLAFVDMYPGDAMYGLGAGEVTGNPNVMDVSQPHGMVYGGGYAAGDIIFRAVNEQREHVLRQLPILAEQEAGIPKLDASKDGFSCIWIAKTTAIPSLSDGLIGIMSGSHLGIVTAFSLGRNDLQDTRLGHGEMTARWILSPGVPIVGIAVDENYSLSRQAQNRIWAVALNALGEIFYLTKFPKRGSAGRRTRSDHEIQRQAWLTGRSVYWNLVEASRRTARSDPYRESTVDGSYSPRSSWNGMCLSCEQIRAETREIEEYMKRKPIQFRKLCHGWDMQRRLEADFAGDDGNFAGEAVIVFDSGYTDDSPATIRRFTRLKACIEGGSEKPSETVSVEGSAMPIFENSLFGPSPIFAIKHGGSPLVGRGRSEHQTMRSSAESSPERRHFLEEWRQTTLAFGNFKNIQISATAIDNSAFAILTASEDPALGMTNPSETSSVFGSPPLNAVPIQNPTDLPGQRARFLAAGTNSGIVFVWDARAPNSKAADLINIVEPVRVIFTDSPEISCLGLSALQLVHGGNDGLVQIWDPLASTTSAIRTLHSRFSARARRRLTQAQASAQGVGINLFAAGAICLDPDASVLRGMVSLGTHLRYWSFSSSVTESYKSNKRRPRRSERGSNSQGGERFTAITRNSNLKGYIANERAALEHEDRRQRRERAHLTNRFGLDMLNSEEEAMAYAKLLSEESLATDEERRRSSAANSPATRGTRRLSAAVKNDASPLMKPQEEFDAEIAQAIQRSLNEEITRSDSLLHTSLPSSPTPYDVPIRIAARKGSRSPKGAASRSPDLARGAAASSSREQEARDLEFALQLSFAEEESMRGHGAGGSEAEAGECLEPGEPGSSVKCKGRAL